MQKIIEQTRTRKVDRISLIFKIIGLFSTTIDGYLTFGYILRFTLTFIRRFIKKRINCDLFLTWKRDLPVFEATFDILYFCVLEPPLDLVDVLSIFDESFDSLINFSSSFSLEALSSQPNHQYDLIYLI